MIDNENVRENLRDHLMTGVRFEVNDGVITGDSLMCQEPEAVAAAMDMYRNHKAGPMTVSEITSHAFMPLPNCQPVPDTNAELQNLLQQYPSDAMNKLERDAICKVLRASYEGTGARFMFLAQANLHNNETAKAYLQDLQPRSLISLRACQTHIFSRRTSHNVSNKFTDAPNIDPQYFSHPLDLELLAHHFNF